MTSLNTINHILKVIYTSLRNHLDKITIARIYLSPPYIGSLIYAKGLDFNKKYGFGSSMYFSHEDYIIQFISSSRHKILRKKLPNTLDYLINTLQEENNSEYRLVTLSLLTSIFNALINWYYLNYNLLPDTTSPDSIVVVRSKEMIRKFIDMMLAKYKIRDIVILGYGGILQYLIRKKYLTEKGDKYNFRVTIVELDIPKTYIFSKNKVKKYNYLLYDFVEFKNKGKEYITNKADLLVVTGSIVPSDTADEVMSYILSGNRKIVLFYGNSLVFLPKVFYQALGDNVLIMHYEMPIKPLLLSRFFLEFPFIVYEGLLDGTSIFRELIYSSDEDIRDYLVNQSKSFR